MGANWQGHEGWTVSRAVVRVGVTALLLCGVIWGEGPETASSRIPADHLQQYSDLAVTWMQEYLRIDTTNPPGHEMKAVEFYKKILDEEGIENQVFEYVPGRGDVWARLARYSGRKERAPLLPQKTRQKWGSRRSGRLFC